MKLFLTLAAGCSSIAILFVLVGSNLLLEKTTREHSSASEMSNNFTSGEDLRGEVRGEQLKPESTPISNIPVNPQQDHGEGSHSQQKTAFSSPEKISSNPQQKEKVQNGLLSSQPSNAFGQSGLKPTPSFSNAAAGSVIEEVELPAGETAPLVLESVTENTTGAEARAMDNIAESYLENLETELAVENRNPSAGQSNAARRADAQLRAIVGYQKADRLDRENFLNSIQK